jgi:hypothetical protein
MEELMKKKQQKSPKNTKLDLHQEQGELEQFYRTGTDDSAGIELEQHRTAQLL